MTQQMVRQSEIFLAEDWQAAFMAFKNVDFQSYSYTTIKSALLRYIQETYPEDFTDYSENSEFMFIVDLLAYLAETLAYRVDLNARDNFFDTAERRESVIRLATNLSYNIHRNQCAKGLVKITSISTTQSVIDSNGVDLANRVIMWNDVANSDWYEQFVLVLNASFVSSNPFGSPVKKLILNNIPVQLYQLNNMKGLSASDGFSIAVSGQAMDFEIVNPDMNEEEGFIEQTPNQNTAKHLIYMNDGSGNNSPNTGFFMLFKQGTLRFEDYVFDLAIENRVLEIGSKNINDSDVWLQAVDSNGSATQTWIKVDSDQNIMYNSIDSAERNIFSVLTRDEDKIALRFSDGRFGNIPTGGFRVWYRQSNGLTYKIRPSDMRNVVIGIPYLQNTNNTNQQFDLTINFSLQAAVDNSLARESIDSIKQKASQVYYTQNRMVNNRDYNSFPLSFGQDILKLKAVNRTYSGHSRYFDLLDTTRNYSSTIEFGDDGALYKENYLYSTVETLPTVKSAAEIFETDIQPLLLDSDYANFFYDQMPTFVVSGVLWGLVNTSNTSETGFLVDTNKAPLQVGYAATNNLKYVSVGSLIEFANPLNLDERVWASVSSVYQDGTKFTDSGDGGITLIDNIPDGWIAYRIYPPFKNIITSINTSDIIEQIENNNTFGLRYDIDTSQWFVVTTLNLDLLSPFSLNNAGDNTNTNKDASWIILCEYQTTMWTFSVRYLKYVFESIERSRFFFSPATRAIDVETNTVRYDTISVLKFNTKPDSIDPLGQDYSLQVSKPIVYDDGYVEPRRIQVIPSDNNTNGVYDNPVEFSNICLINPSDPNSYVFQKRFTDSNGYDYYQIINASDITKYTTIATLLAQTTLVNGSIAFVLETGEFFEYIDGSASPITTVANQQKIFYQNHGLQTGDKVVFYVNPPPDPPTVLSLPQPLQTKVVYYAYVTDANYFYLGQTLADVMAYTPTLLTMLTSGVGTISIIKEITETNRYKAFIGRQNLNYSYEHFASQDERIDPSVSNVMDMFILTRSYYNEVLTWKNSQSRNSIPVPPTSFSLQQQFSSLEKYKMSSDEIIFQPAKFKLLFGEGAMTELKATFKVVKAYGSTVTDNEIKQKVIQTIDDFFDVSKNRFDFGEVFYFTELAAYIHKELATFISSVVIVPQTGVGNFGELFQVRSAFDEIFISTANVSNVEIINSLTLSNLKV